MRKYVNGQYIEMTEEDIIKAKERFGIRRNVRPSEYERRVKELETTVATLTAKLEGTNSDVAE